MANIEKGVTTLDLKTIGILGLIILYRISSSLENIEAKSTRHSDVCLCETCDLKRTTPVDY